MTQVILQQKKNNRFNKNEKEKKKKKASYFDCIFLSFSFFFVCVNQNLSISYNKVYCEIYFYVL